MIICSLFLILTTYLSSINSHSFKCADRTDTCYCDGDVYYGRKYLVGNSGTETNITTIQIFTYYVQYDISYSIECRNNVFGNPAAGYTKHCICNGTSTISDNPTSQPSLLKKILFLKHM